jgi:hypothetical protein
VDTYTEEEFKQHLNAYDGSLTTYLLGLNTFAFKCGMLGQQVHRNDYTDIKHLLYLRSENDIIVSNDSIFTKIIGQTQLMKIEDFKKVFNL